MSTCHSFKAFLFALVLCCALLNTCRTFSIAGESDELPPVLSPNDEKVKEVQFEVRKPEIVIPEDYPVYAYASAYDTGLGGDALPMPRRAEPAKVTKPKIRQIRVTRRANKNRWCHRVGCVARPPKRKLLQYLPSKTYIMFALFIFRAPEIGPQHVTYFKSQGTMIPDLTSINEKDEYQFLFSTLNAFDITDRLIDRHTYTICFEGLSKRPQVVVECRADPFKE